MAPSSLSRLGVCLRVRWRGSTGLTGVVMAMMQRRRRMSNDKIRCRHLHLRTRRRFCTPRTAHREQVTLAAPRMPRRAARHQRRPLTRNSRRCLSLPQMQTHPPVLPPLLLLLLHHHHHQRAAHRSFRANHLTFPTETRANPCARSSPFTVIRHWEIR